MIIKTKMKKWGNSLGVVIPAESVDSLGLRPEEEITIEISRKGNVLKELFGAVKLKRPTKEVVHDARKDLEGEWL